MFNIKTLFKCFKAGYILAVFVMTALHFFKVDKAPHKASASRKVFRFDTRLFLFYL